MNYMDNFHSDLKNDQFEHQSELPEDFGWEDMREGIYEKMQTTKPEKNNRRWYLLLLLLLIIGSTGSWLVLEHLNAEKTIADSITLNQAHKKEIKATPENIQSKTKTPQQSSQSNLTEDILPQSKQKHEKVVDKKKKPSKLLSTNTTQSNTKPLKTTVNYIAEESKTIKENKSNIPSNRIINPTQKRQTTKPSNNKPVAVAQEVLTEVNKLPKIPLQLIENKPSNLAPFDSSKDIKTAKEIKTSAFRKHLSFGLAGGITNWAALDATNINHDYVSGFPGYHINPSVSLSFTPKHALQIDYEYSALEELFDYEGSRAIQEVKEDETVTEVFSSLTGNLLYSVQEDVTVNGIRHYRELKYNQYKLHTLSLGYRFDQITKKKSSFGFYLGASYLLQLNSKGKRLNEALDIVSFDDDNPLFQKNQLGLRLGLHYNYQLNTNTSLFSQVMSTKYITNWELDNSNSATRPLLYGLQIGVKYRLNK